METIVPEESLLSNPQTGSVLFALLVQRLGGKVSITQADIDDMYGFRLLENHDAENGIEFKIIIPLFNG